MPGSKGMVLRAGQSPSQSEGQCGGPREDAHSPRPWPHFTLGSGTALVLGQRPPLSQHQVGCPLSRVAYPSGECTSGV